MKKRADKLSSVVFSILVIMIVLLAISNYLASGLYARYLSVGRATDDARVAKWEISFEDENGTVLNSSMPSVHLEYGTSGSYGLDIVNYSEVPARINSSSSVKLRLTSPNFNLEHHHEYWDFLEDNNHNSIDNPINFRVYLYNCSWDTLENYYLTDGVFDNSIQQPGLDVQQYLILDTNDNINPLRFEMNIDDGEFHYDTTVYLTELTEKFNIASDGGSLCLRVTWDVNQVDNNYTSNDNFVSYHMVEVSKYDVTKYVGIINKNSLDKIELTAIDNTVIGNNSITIADKTYVIAYRIYDYFEYLIYTSSLGGEVMITYDDVEGIYIKRATKLTDAEKTSLNARSISDATTIEGLRRFVEKLEYLSFLEYLNVKKVHEQATGYVSLGIKCAIIFKFNVEQVD